MGDFFILFQLFRSRSLPTERAEYQENIRDQPYPYLLVRHKTHQPCQGTAPTAENCSGGSWDPVI